MKKYYEFDVKTGRYIDLGYKQDDMFFKPPEIGYDERVNNLIRERYSASQEFSILRQKEIKPQEYDEYFRYCEECKQRAKQ